MASNITKKLGVKGLVTYRDQYSEIPDGAVSEANNIVLDKPGSLSPRPGFSFSETGGAGTLGYEVESSCIFNNKLVFIEADQSIPHLSISTQTLPSTVITNSTPISLLGTIDPTKHISYAKMNGSLFIADGVNRIKAWDGTGLAIIAGAGKASTPTNITSSATTVDTTYFAAGTEISYRIVWGYRDDNDNLVLGAPSEKMVQVMADRGAGLGGVPTFTIYPYAGLGNNDQNTFVQVYKTKTAARPVAGASGDIMFLAAEYTAAQVGTSLVFTDLFNDLVLGAPLYTNSTSEGILQSNYVPPIAKSIATYNNYMVYANCIQPGSATYTMVGLPTAGNSITVTSGTSSPYTQQPKTFVAGTDFTIVPGSISGTTKNLVTAINNYFRASEDIEAFYSSGNTGFPGQFIIFGLDPTCGFTVQSTTMAISPSISSVDTIDPLQLPNRIYLSKFQEPGAVPYSNYFDVGEEDDEILSIAVIRDSLIIIKRRSIWKLVGDFLDTMTLTLINSTTYTVTERSVQVLGDYVYGLSDQGIYRVSSSVEIISKVIHNLVTELVNSEIRSWVDDAHQLYFLYRGGLSATVVWDALHQVFFTWSFPVVINCGIADLGRLYLGTGESNQVSPTALAPAGFLVQRGDWEEGNSCGDIVNLSWVDITAVSPIGPIADATSITIKVSTSIYKSGGYVGQKWRARIGAGRIEIASIIDETTVVMTVLAEPALTPTIQDYLGLWLQEVAFYSPYVAVTITPKPLGNVLTPSSLNNIGLLPGDVIKEYIGSGIARVKEVSRAIPRSITVEWIQPASYTDARWIIHKGVTSSVAFWPFLGKGIEVYKDFKEIATICPVHPYGPMKLTYSTDLTLPQTFEEYQYTSSPLGWGNFSWGMSPWGEEGDLSEEVERSVVPVVLHKGHKLNYKWEVTTSYQRWEFSGISLQYRDIGFTPSRGGQ